MNPKVSVITATYNSSRTLRCTIESVLAQDVQDFEYIVVGDACTDNSQNVVQSFGDPRIRWHNLITNSGSQSIPNNAGLEFARAQYIAYIGHDDLWFPNHLSSLLRLLEDGKGSLAHSLSFMIGPEGLRIVYGVPGTGRHYGNFATPPSSWCHVRNEQRWRDADHLGRAVDNDFFWRWHASGGVVTRTHLPTLLKFPSAWWRLYARQNDFPQERFLEGLRVDSDELLKALLFESASLLSERYSGLMSGRRWLKEAFKPLAFSVMSANNPEAPWLKWGFQHFRRVSRRARGLK